MGSGGWRGRRSIGRGEAEGVVDGFEKDGYVDRLVNIGDCSGFEGGIAIADGCARRKDDDGYSASVEEQRQSLQNDEAIAGGNAEIENDEIGLLFAGGANGSQSVAGGNDFESGRLEAAGKSGELNDLILDY